MDIKSILHHADFRMDIDYSPTGREFVTGSYDRTVSYVL